MLAPPAVTPVSVTGLHCGDEKVDEITEELRAVTPVSVTGAPLWSFHVGARSYTACLRNTATSEPVPPLGVVSRHESADPVVQLVRHLRAVCAEPQRGAEGL